MYGFDDENFGLPSKPDCLNFNPIELGIDRTLQFKYADAMRPTNFNTMLQNSSGPEKQLMEFKKGTTTLGFKTKDGVFIAVDSRASMGTFNSSETVRKVIEINDYLLGTMAGGAADCQYWEEYIAMRARDYELQYGVKMTVAATSKMLANIMYNYRGKGLSMGIMFAGVDRKGTHLYYIDDHGTRLEGDMFSIGSGQTYALGILSSYYNWNMSKDAAHWLCKRAISEATYQDAGSGGCVRVYHFSNDSPKWECLADYVDNSNLNWENMKKNRTTGEERFVENIW